VRVLVGLTRLYHVAVAVAVAVGVAGGVGRRNLLVPLWEAEPLFPGVR